MRHDQQQRQEHGTERVDVWNGIQRQPPGVLGGRIAEAIRHRAVSHLMQNDGRQNRQGPHGYLLNERFHVFGTASRKGSQPPLTFAP